MIRNSPRVCMVCGKMIDGTDETICSWCRKELRRSGKRLIILGGLLLAGSVVVVMSSLFFTDFNTGSVTTLSCSEPLLSSSTEEERIRFFEEFSSPTTTLPDVRPNCFPFPFKIGKGEGFMSLFMEAPVKLALSDASRSSVREVKKPSSGARPSHTSVAKPKLPEKRPTPSDHKKSAERRSLRHPSGSRRLDPCSERVDFPKRMVKLVKKKRRKHPLRDELVSLQREDGTWSSGFRIREYDLGATSLAVTALLYAGEPRDSEVIRRAFGALKDWSPRLTYTAGIALMMVEAFCAEEGLFGEEFRREMRRRFKESPVWMRRLAYNARSVLLRSQTSFGYWAYGPIGMGHNQSDLSNTQFAAFGLYAAANLGMRVPKSAFQRLLKALLASQQRKGPVLKESFDVPLARLRPSDLRALEKRGVTDVPPVNPNAPMRTRPVLDERRVSVPVSDLKAALRTAVQRSGERVTPPVMMARGFGYKSSKKFRPTISMTAAGLASLAICKVMLGRHSADVNRAIRDAAAWLLLHIAQKPYSVNIVHKFIRYSGEGYTAYTVCRAAVLCGVAGFLSRTADTPSSSRLTVLESAFYMLSSCKGVVGFVGGVGGFWDGGPTDEK